MNPNFAQAKSAATRLLLNQPLRSLRVDPTKLQYDAHIFFDTMQHFCAVTCATLDDYSEFLKDGCTLVRQKDGRVYYVVLYNVDKNKRRQNFTLAHEAGHILLGHKCDEYTQEAEANCFASQLLAPLILVWELSVRSPYPLTPADLCQVFSLSHTAAENRLQDLARRPCFNQDDAALLKRFSHLLPDFDAPLISV